MFKGHDGFGGFGGAGEHLALLLLVLQNTGQRLATVTVLKVFGDV